LNELKLIKEKHFLMAKSNKFGTCNKAAKVMITSIFAKRPFKKLNLLPKLKAFANRDL